MYDNVCKYLAERFPGAMGRWLLGLDLPLVSLPPTELIPAPIRADSLICLHSTTHILHLEFQTHPDPEMPVRMLDYAVRLYRKYPGVRLHQVVVYLRQTSSPQVYQGCFEQANTVHRFQVVRLWEVDAERLLGEEGLLPWVVLAEPEGGERRLRQVRERLERISDRQLRAELGAATAVLAGLALDRGVIQQILGDVDMKESVIYQAWRQEALQEGLEQGRLVEARRIARQLLHMGMDPQQVMTITGLSQDELNQLSHQQN